MKITDDSISSGSPEPAVLNLVVEPLVILLVLGLVLLL
jgi:hypothetical protein